MDEDGERERSIVENLMRAAARISNLSQRQSMPNNQLQQSVGVQEYVANAFPTARGRNTNASGTSGGGQTSGLPGSSAGKKRFEIAS